MSEPIEDRYFGWLYAKVAPHPRSTPSRSYIRLFQTLHETPFVWLLPGDANRAEEGIDLRTAFLREDQAEYNEPWMALECSVLEMMIAFTRRCEFQTERSGPDWFWLYLKNLGLADISDGVYDAEQDPIDEILDTFAWRRYGPLGHGGMFPLRYSDNDQREVDIWYQFCEYLVENGID